MQIKRAILHIDGDAFFASCAQAMSPDLKGKPVVIGAERGLATAVSYEAKKYGIKRGMVGSEIKELCPNCCFVEADYQAFQVFSQRMFRIIKRFSPEVEKYSVDECFADLTGLRRPYNNSYLKLAKRIKKQIEQSLDLTVSLGLASTKTLAKIASEREKPSGLVVIPDNKIPFYLKGLELQEVWGIGPQTAAYLHKLGLQDGLDFIKKSKGWVKHYLTRPHYQTWQELKGRMVFNLETGKKEKFKTIIRSRTFSPPSKDKGFVFAELSRNIEEACKRLRKVNLIPEKIGIMLKTQKFEYRRKESKLEIPTNSPNQIVRQARSVFNQLFQSELYRSTGVIMMNLQSEDLQQYGLFASVEKHINKESIFKDVDQLEEKYGSNTIFLGSSMQALKPQVKRFQIPFLGKVS